MPGPFDEAGVDDDLRAHPVRAQARQSLGLGERRLRNLERVQPLTQLQQQRGVEASADLPGKAEVVAVALDSRK